MMKRFSNICAVLVPADLGRLYQRTATTDPRDYRQSPIVQSDTVSTSSASTALVNDDWRQALDETEDELLSCAAQVLTVSICSSLNNAHTC